MIVVALVVGITVMAIGIGYIGGGNVRHVEIILPEQVKQTVAFRETNGEVQLVGLIGTGEVNNPTLVTRVSFEYVLTVVNQGTMNHRLYIEGLNLRTELLEPGEGFTIRMTPTTEGIYTYYDDRDRPIPLGQVKVVAVSPDENF